MTLQFRQEKKGSGAISINFINRWIHRNLRRHKVAGTVPFDWTAGFDVRNKIGPMTIKNQGTNDSCGGQAGSYAMEISRRMQGITEGPISAKSIYAPIAYPGGGTTVSSLTTQFCTKGGNLEVAVPSYDANGNPLSESLMEDNSWDTPVMAQNALTRAGYTPLDINITMDEIASAIESYGFVIWEIRGQVNGTWASPYPQPPVKGATGEFFAHFMCLIGAETINGVPTIIALESEGIDQGIQGIQYFTENYINSGYIVDCFTFVSDEKIGSLPPNMNPWNALLTWFQSIMNG